MLVVARTPTPVAQSAFPGLIQRAFEAEGIPLPGLARMMLSVLASIETARGRSVMNHNIGNITASERFDGAVWRPPWFELDPGALQRGEVSPKLVELHEAMLRGQAPSAFRAYPSADDGARDFARVLAKNFPEVLRAARVPNAENFRKALAEKYSHDYRNPAATKSLAALMRDFGITSASGAVGGVVALLVLFAAYRLLRR